MSGRESKADIQLKSYQSTENYHEIEIEPSSSKNKVVPFKDETVIEEKIVDKQLIEDYQTPTEITEDDSLTRFLKKYATVIRYFLLALFAAAYTTFVVFTFLCGFDRIDSIWVLVITCIAILAIIYSLLEMLWKKNASFASCIDSLVQFLERHQKIIGIVIGVALAIVVVTVVVLLGIQYPSNLISLSGVACILLGMFIFSRNRRRIQWRIVVTGVLLHQVFALFIIFIPFGAAIMSEIGKVVEIFYSYGEAGAAFVFGDKYTDHPFAFSVMPTLVFFSGVISVLYYYGAAQWFIKKFAFAINFVMGTSPAQSVVAVGNIFLGQTEAALLVQPVLPDVTNAELHAILLSGFATVSGSILAAYIIYGVKASHLLGASLMAAPASLVLANMLYPETEVSKVDKSYIRRMPRPDYTNTFHAFSAGASTSIPIVANIVVNLIAFISALELFNGILKWIGECLCLGIPLTFELICSYLFWPIALVLGVSPDMCQKVAELIGIKLFINELVAYSALGVLISNGDILEKYNGTVIEQGQDLFLPGINTTLVGGVLDNRSETIATYALCGFANFGSMGLQLGGIGALAPTRRQDLARLAFSAMLGGTLTSLFSASVAGLYYTS